MRVSPYYLDVLSVPHLSTKVTEKLFIPEFYVPCQNSYGSGKKNMAFRQKQLFSMAYMVNAFLGFGFIPHPSNLRGSPGFSLRIYSWCWSRYQRDNRDQTSVDQARQVLNLLFYVPSPEKGFQ